MTNTSDPEGLHATHLAVATAQDSSAGEKPINEDSMGMLVPSDLRTLTHKGVALVIADGVSAAEAGREAAEICVQSFLGDYFSTPETWTVETSARKVLGALNGWLYRQSSQFIDSCKGYVSTFSALVVKGHTAHVFHVGDSRVYRYRSGRLEQLTRDHTVTVSPKERYLARAMGLDSGIDIDFQSSTVEIGDRFLLTTDGIHDFVDSEVLASTIREGELEASCKKLIETALGNGSKDNLTCQLLEVLALPGASADEYIERLAALPFPPELSVGMILDSFRVERELHLSKRSQLYLVSDERSRQRLVMKTPSVNYEDDPAYIERFMLEQWVGSRSQSRHLVKSVDPGNDRSCLYNLMEYIEGPTLAQWIASRRGSKPRQLDEAIDIVGQLVRGLQALHRKQILHQDIKPANVIIDPNGVVKIIDYGSCLVAGVEELPAPIERARMLGTVTYAAPEYSLGLKPEASSDLYSLGCVAYELLTFEHPYGALVENARTHADFQKLRYTPAYRHNPHVPLWLDGAIERAVRIDPRQRYQELSEFAYDIENPNSVYLEARPILDPESDAQRWRRLALLLLLTQIATLLYLLVE